jgi:DNA polymerase-3 subunit epsilon
MKNHPKPKLRDKVILWARDVLDHKDRYVILDTETTGLNKNDVLIQIAIIDLNGNELLNPPVKPTKRKRMSAESTAIHRLTMRDLANAPIFDVLRPEIDRIIASKIVLIYNAEFDARLIRQTTTQDECPLPRLRATCVMQHYSWFVQEWSDYHNDWKYQKPSRRSSAAIPPEPHWSASCKMRRLYVAVKRLRAALSLTSGLATVESVGAAGAVGMVAPPLREGSPSSPSLRSGATIPTSLFNSAIPILDFLPTLYIKLTWGRCLSIIGTEGFLKLQ